jgi:hypothetical protein
MTEDQEKRWRANIAAMPGAYGVADEFGREVFDEIDNLRAVVERLGRERDSLADALAGYETIWNALNLIHQICGADDDLPVDLWRIADKAIEKEVRRRTGR